MPLTTEVPAGVQDVLCTRGVLSTVLYFTWHLIVYRIIQKHSTSKSHSLMLSYVKCNQI